MINVGENVMSILTAKAVFHKLLVTVVTVWVYSYILYTNVALVAALNTVLLNVHNVNSWTKTARLHLVRSFTTFTLHYVSGSNFIQSIIHCQSIREHSLKSQIWVFMYENEKKNVRMVTNTMGIRDSWDRLIFTNFASFLSTI